MTAPNSSAWPSRKTATAAHDVKSSALIRTSGCPAPAVETRS